MEDNSHYDDNHHNVHIRSYNQYNPPDVSRKNIAVFLLNGGIGNQQWPGENKEYVEWKESVEAPSNTSRPLLSNQLLHHRMGENAILPFLNSHLKL